MPKFKREDLESFRLEEDEVSSPEEKPEVEKVEFDPKAFVQEPKSKSKSKIGIVVLVKESSLIVALNGANQTIPRTSENRNLKKGDEIKL